MSWSYPFSPSSLSLPPLLPHVYLKISTKQSSVRPVTAAYVLGCGVGLSPLRPVILRFRACLSCPYLWCLSKNKSCYLSASLYTLYIGLFFCFICVFLLFCPSLGDVGQGILVFSGMVSYSPGWPWVCFVAEKDHELWISLLPLFKCWDRRRSPPSSLFCLCAVISITYKNVYFS